MFVRSDVAHGVVNAIHIDDAIGMPGVVAILTADNLGVAPHHGFVPVHPDFVRPPLADGKVRFVGEPIAVVLAETFEQGEDAAELIWADIDPLPAVTVAEAALADGAPVLFDVHGSNVAQVHIDPRSTASPAPTTSCAVGTSTSASPSCRWNPTAAPPRSTPTDG